jgi:hypothetical protein
MNTFTPGRLFSLPDERQTQAAGFRLRGKSVSTPIFDPTGPHIAI